VAHWVTFDFFTDYVAHRVNLQKNITGRVAFKKSGGPSRVAY
jgi:hypothetical protein